MTQEEFKAKLEAISDQQLAEMAQSALSKLCSTAGKSFTMTVPPRIDDTDMILSEVIRRFELLGAVASEEFVEKFTENQLLSATDLLGAVSPAPNDIDRLEFAVFWDMFARMKRVVKNWQDGVNGKFEVKVKEENKEWMLKLMEETNEMLRYWDSVFED